MLITILEYKFYHLNFIVKITCVLLDFYNLLVCKCIWFLMKGATPSTLKHLAYNIGYKNVIKHVQGKQVPNFSGANDKTYNKQME